MTGTRIGRYEVRHALGRGGMGEVYLARDLTTGREVAIKVMLPLCAADPRMVARFHREIQVCRSLDHPHLVKVLAHGTVGDDHLPYLVMEYVPGRTLGEVFEERRILTIDELFRLGEEVGGALAAVHARGIIHRDLKPANVIVKPDGQFVLMDLGVALVLDWTVLTRTGRAVGTPAYMSPEVLLGKQAIPASDVYQLGLLLYEGAAGRLPHPAEGGVEGLLDYALDGKPPPLSATRDDVPAPLERTILQALCCDPAGRYRTAGEFLVALEEARARAPAPVHEPAAPRPPPPAVDARAAEGQRPPAPSTMGTLLQSRWKTLTSKFETIPPPLLWTGLALPALLLAVLAWIAMHQSAVDVRRVQAVPDLTCALVTWETTAPVRTALRVRSVSDPPWVQDFDGPGAPVTRHRLVLENLEPGREYLATVLLDGQPASMDHGFRCPERFLFQGPRVETSQIWPPTIAWTTRPPTRSDATYRHGQGTFACEVTTGDPAEVHRFRPQEWDPLLPLEDVIVVSRTVTGRTITSGPFRLPGLPETWVQRVAECGETQLTKRLLDAIGRCAHPSRHGLAREETQKALGRLGLAPALARVTPLVTRALAGHALPLADRVRLYHSFLPLRVADQLCTHYRIPPIFATEDLLAPVVAASLEPLLPVTAGTVILDLPFEHWANHFFPVNVDESLHRKFYALYKTMSPQVKKPPYAHFRHVFEVEERALAGARVAQVLVRSKQPFSHYYFEVTVAGDPPLRLLLHNPRTADDPTVKAHPFSVAAWEVSVGKGWQDFYARFPAAVLRPGRNAIDLALHTMTKMEAYPVPVTSVRIRVQ